MDQSQNPFGDAPQQPAPAPVTPNAPIASVVPPISPGDTPKKSRLGLILGLSIGGGVLIIGAIVVILLLVLGGGSNIKTLDDLQKAITNKGAINCVVSGDGNSMTIQTTKGWDKFYVSANTTSDGKMSLLAIKGDAMYMWNDQKAQKSDYDSNTLDSFIDAMGVGSSDDEDNSGTTVKCSSPSKADFSVPNKKWTTDNASDELDDFDTDVTTDDGGGTTGAAISINATINDTNIGVKYQATKLVMNAFTVPQNVKDDHYWTDQVPVLVYVTASRTSDSMAVAEVDYVDFVDADGNSIMDYSGNSDMKSLTQDAGYTVKRDYASADKGGSVSDWIILMVDPSVTKDDIYMVYNQPSYQIIGGSGGTIAAETFKVQLTK